MIFLTLLGGLMICNFGIKKDYWATRMEFVGKGAGDCEDYVIAKYFTPKATWNSNSKNYTLHTLKP